MAKMQNANVIQIQDMEYLLDGNSFWLGMSDLNGGRG